MSSLHTPVRRLIGVALLLLVAIGAAAKDRPKPQPDPILESDQPDAPKKAVKLPLLDKGPGKGYYIYHKGRNFEAMVDGGGALQIYLLDPDGKRLQKKPWAVCGGIHTSWSKLIGYNPKNDRPIVKSFARYMKEIKSADDPTDEPRGNIEIKARLMDDVDFVRRFEFSRDGVKVWTGFDCPNKAHPSRYRSGISFPACKSFGRNVEQPEREKALKGYELKIAGPSAKKKHDSQTIPFSASENFRIRAANEMTSVGPWGDLVVNIKADDPVLRPTKYSGKCPYEGYSLYFDVPNGSDKGSKQVQIELEFK